MADSKIGKVYEAILAVALEQLLKRSHSISRVFWNQNPEGVDVEPDLLIGESVDHPEYIFCVTHSASAKESDKKNWRNLGELSELKSVLDPLPVVINVFFESVLKSDLKDIQSASFDAQLMVDERPYAKKLGGWVRRNTNYLPHGQQEIADEIRQLVRKNATLKSVIEGVIADLRIMVRKRNVELDGLWILERKRVKKLPPEPVATTIRRGLSKLLIFEDLDLGINLYLGKRISVDRIPGYVFALGLARRSIDRARPSDSDIKGALTLLKIADVRAVCKKGKEYDVLNEMLSRVRMSSTQIAIGNFIKENFALVSDGDKLYDALIKLYADPGSLSLQQKEPIPNWPPNEVWLATYLMEIAKQMSAQKNGYGTSQLAREIFELGLCEEADLSDAGQFAGGFGFPAWLCRKKTSFRDDLIRAVAQVLSAKMKSLGEQGLKNVIDTSGVGIDSLRNIVETKICTYRLFDPLAELLKARLSGVSEFSCKSCFAEYARVKGSAGKISALRVGDVVIKCQSSNHLKHSTDKRKELCGRAIGLRYTWNPNTHRFENRSGVSRLILLLDGVWSPAHLKSLVTAGWDEIYFPNQLDELVASVLGEAVEMKRHRWPKPNSEEEDLPLAADHDELEVKRYGRKK